MEQKTSWRTMEVNFETRMQTRKAKRPRMLSQVVEVLTGNSHFQGNGGPVWVELKVQETTK